MTATNTTSTNVTRYAYGIDIVPERAVISDVSGGRIMIVTRGNTGGVTGAIPGGVTGAVAITAALDFNAKPTRVGSWSDDRSWLGA